MLIVKNQTFLQSNLRQPKQAAFHRIKTAGLMELDGRLLDVYPNWLRKRMFSDMG